MINDKKHIYFALIAFFASMALNFPFPEENPIGLAVVSVFNITVKSVNGLNYAGISSLFLLIISLYLIVKSLKKYHVRFVFVAILASMFIPPLAVRAYQETFAAGIYAISYHLEDSKCHFKKYDEDILHGVCELPFENHSKSDVHFNVEFYKKYQFEGETPMISLMNNDAPYKVVLTGKQSKRIHIETNIDVSKMKNHFDQGDASKINIIIKSEAKSRNL